MLLHKNIYTREDLLQMVEEIIQHIHTTALPEFGATWELEMRLQLTQKTAEVVAATPMDWGQRCALLQMAGEKIAGRRLDSHESLARALGIRSYVLKHNIQRQRPKRTMGREWFKNFKKQHGHVFTPDELRQLQGLLE